MGYGGAKGYQGGKSYANALTWGKGGQWHDWSAGQPKGHGKNSSMPPKGGGKGQQGQGGKGGGHQGGGKGGCSQGRGYDGSPRSWCQGFCAEQGYDTWVYDWKNSLFCIKCGGAWGKTKKKKCEGAESGAGIKEDAGKNNNSSKAESGAKDAGRGKEQQEKPESTGQQLQMLQIETMLSMLKKMAAQQAPDDELRIQMGKIMFGGGKEDDKPSKTECELWTEARKELDTAQQQRAKLERLQQANRKLQKKQKDELEATIKEGDETDRKLEAAKGRQTKAEVELEECKRKYPLGMPKDEEMAKVDDVPHDGGNGADGVPQVSGADAAAAGGTWGPAKKSAVAGSATGGGGNNAPYLKPPEQNPTGASRGSGEWAVVGPGGRTLPTFSKEDMELDPALPGLLEAARKAEEAAAQATASFQSLLQEQVTKKRKAEAGGALPGREDAERIQKEAEEAAKKAAEEAAK